MKAQTLLENQTLLESIDAQMAHPCYSTRIAYNRLNEILKLKEIIKEKDKQIKEQDNQIRAMKDSIDGIALQFEDIQVLETEEERYFRLCCYDGDEMVADELEVIKADLKEHGYEFDEERYYGK